ncbi:hypothetical protein QVD17_17437 [Tagetes erecta]|uniref:F-box domain-containing protein n=1 Tax=Tagetes erecta TaxID=13708 RepID=A0AAD8P0B0_TARER|nr:hypothetical protein QVD17_17437 [Tagetes erecta]
MSDNIPFEMHVEIMKKLPAKSLIQFRSVSKSWKHLIDSSDFITYYSGRHTHTQHLVVSTFGTAETDLKHVLVADDDTFPQQHFREVKLPCSLANTALRYDLSMSKLRESLVVIQRTREENDEVSSVWMMEDGDPELFTKLFTVNTNALFGQIMGFRKSGEAIIRIYDVCKFSVYKPCSRHFDEHRIDGIGLLHSVHPYVETLLLHDQPNLKMFCL